MTLKIAAFAPIPRPSVRIATVVNAGVRAERADAVSQVLPERFHAASRVTLDGRTHCKVVPPGPIPDNVEPREQCGAGTRVAASARRSVVGPGLQSRRRGYTENDATTGAWSLVPTSRNTTQVVAAAASSRLAST